MAHTSNQVTMGNDQKKNPVQLFFHTYKRIRYSTSICIRIRQISFGRNDEPIFFITFVERDKKLERQSQKNDIYS